MYGIQGFFEYLSSKMEVYIYTRSEVEDFISKTSSNSWEEEDGDVNFDVDGVC